MGENKITKIRTLRTRCTLCRCALQSILPVFVGNEEGSFDVTTIWILSFSVEHFFVVFVVVQIHGTVEREQNHLWCLKQRKEKEEKNNNSLIRSIG